MDYLVKQTSVDMNNTIMASLQHQSYAESMFDALNIDSTSSYCDHSNLKPQRKVSKSESIHSGHFMVSEIDENESAQYKDGKEADLEPPGYEHIQEKEVGTSTRMISPDLIAHSSTQTSVYGTKYNNNFVMIDDNLTKLFQCMSLAFEGKITSPKWKAFKGLKLNIKDKIRLNNIIWRAWHIQCT